MSLENAPTAESFLRRTALRFPTKTAFVDDTRKISFSQLDKEANRLADYLRDIGVSRHEPTVLMLEKSVDFVVAIFAVWKTGSFYVPVDVHDKSGRTKYILSDLGPCNVVTRSAHLPMLGSAPPDASAKVVVWDSPQSRIRLVAGMRMPLIEPSERLPVMSRVSRSSRGGLAYVLYTSGSTGQPKGVAIAHAGLVNFVEETARMFSFTQSTRIMSVKSFSVDSSLTDILCPLYAGGTTYIERDVDFLMRRLQDRIMTRGVTHLSLTPALIKLAAERRAFGGGNLSSLRTLSFGSDIVPASRLMKIQEDLGGVRLFNRYGPTECSVVTSGFEISHITDRREVIPIGKPWRNVTYHLFEGSRELTGPGVTGELYIGGVQVMDGYWNDPDLTKQVLVDDFVSGQIMYKTGDLVTRTTDGNYVFIGRTDSVINRKWIQDKLDRGRSCHSSPQLRQRLRLRLQRRPR